MDAEIETILFLVLAMFSMVIGFINKTVAYRLVMFTFSSLLFFIAAASFETGAFAIGVGLFGCVSVFMATNEYRRVK